jgi:hypothetical protein
MKTTRSLLLAICLAGLLAGSAGADQITYRNIPYTGTLTGYSNFVLKFKAGTGATFDRKLAEVQRIDSSRNKALTQAEEALAGKKFDAALKAYDQALRAARYAWEKQLIRDRKFLAVARSGQPDQAVADWLAMVDDSQSSEGALAMRSAIQPALKGPRANRSAVVKLSAKQLQLSKAPRKHAAYLRAVLELKLRLQESNGDADGAAKTAEAIMALEKGADASPARPSAPGQPAMPAPARTTSRGGAGKVAILNRLLESGKTDDVINSILTHYPDYGRKDQPAMALLLGRAQQAKAKQADDNTLLKQAGLNFIYVYTEFGQDPEAIEALYRAAMVNKALGDMNGTGHALTALVNAYGEDAENPWVAKARDALDGLRAAGGAANE